MSANREWLDNWLATRAKSPAADGPDGPAAAGDSAVPPVTGHVVAHLSPAGQRRLFHILQQNEIRPGTRFVAFRAEAFREKDLLDSFEAMIKRPNQRSEARYVPHSRPGPDGDGPDGDGSDSGQPDGDRPD